MLACVLACLPARLLVLAHLHVLLLWFAFGDQDVTTLKYLRAVLATLVLEVEDAMLAMFTPNGIAAVSMLNTCVHKSR